MRVVESGSTPRTVRLALCAALIGAGLIVASEIRPLRLVHDVFAACRSASTLR